MARRYTAVFLLSILKANISNEWYARNISKKRRISNKIKRNAGEPMGQPPYGYIKDPDNPKRWIVDDEAAQVVRRIYSRTLEGYGTERIATQLERDETLTPRAYWLKKGIKRPGKGKQQPATKWNSSTVTKILSLQEYCGDILNFKTYSKSYKNKKRLENDRENWVVFKDVHEPIIERSVFEQVQQKQDKIRKRRTNEGEHNMFSGLLVCADCGSNLHFHLNQGNPEIKYFNCSNYKGNRGNCTSTHYVRVDFLEQVVLGEIRRLTKFASLYEDEFLKAVIGHFQQAAETDRKLKEKELKALLARDEELDGLFERIYVKQLFTAVLDHVLKLRTVIRFRRERTVNVVPQDRDAVLFRKRGALTDLPFNGFLALTVQRIPGINHCFDFIHLL